MAVSKWSWSVSNGTATAAQVQAAYNALTNKGRTKAFNYTVWNDIVTKISAVRSDWGDIAWNEHYELLPFDESKMKSGSIMTADRFNTAVGNIPLFGYAWPWESTLGRSEILKGDRCYGQYFVWLTDGLNHWIGLTKLPFTIHDSYYLGDNASIQQKDSHPLAHTWGITLGKTFKMSNLAAHDFVIHSNLMHLDHNFVMTNMPNALAFSSTFNFFDFNTLMAKAETHIVGNQSLNVSFGQKLEGLFTESLPLAHYLPATSEEIILVNDFTRSIGNAIYGAHSGVVSGLMMSGTHHSANSLSLDYTGEMQTGYKFNFSLDINSGIGEYLNYISVLDSFTLATSSITNASYAGSIPVIDAISQFDAVRIHETDIFTDGIGFFPNTTITNAYGSPLEQSSTVRMQGVYSINTVPIKEVQASTANAFSTEGKLISSSRKIFVAEVSQVINVSAEFAAQQVKQLSANTQETLSADVSLIRDSFLEFEAETESAFQTDGDVLVANEVIVATEVTTNFDVRSDLATDNMVGFIGQSINTVDVQSELVTSENVFMSADSESTLIPESELTTRFNTTVESNTEITTDVLGETVAKTGLPIATEVTTNFDVRSDLATQLRAFIPDTTLNVGSESLSEIYYRKGCSIDGQAFETVIELAELQAIGHSVTIEAFITGTMSDLSSAELDVSRNKLVEVETYVDFNIGSPVIDMRDPLSISGQATTFADEETAEIDYVLLSNAGISSGELTMNHIFVQTTGSMTPVFASDIDDELASNVGNKLINDVENHISLD